VPERRQLDGLAAYSNRQQSFGPLGSGPRRLTPTPRREGQHQLGFLPLASHELQFLLAPHQLERHCIVIVLGCSPGFTRRRELLKNSVAGLVGTNSLLFINSLPHWTSNEFIESNELSYHALFEK